MVPRSDESRPLDPDEITEAEPLEQTELRKRLKETVAEERARRATEAEEAEERGREPEPDWEPPEEADPESKWGKILVRVSVFVVLLVGLWFLFQQASFAVFRPELVALEPAVPDGRLSPGTPVTVGVRMTNTSSVDGEGLVVAAFPSGEQVEGPGFEVPADDTVLVPVTLELAEGDHVFSLVAFGSWRGEVERLETFSGLTLWVGTRELELDEVVLPDRLERSDTVPVEFSATNPGDRLEDVVPVFVFVSPSGESIEMAGPAVELPPGETGTLRVTIVAHRLESGPYSVRVLARAPDGLRLAQVAREHRVDVGR